MIRTALMALALAASLSAAATAQTPRSCETFEANARNLAWPYQSATRTFAEGAIALIALDTIEPACCSYHLMVLFPHGSDPYPQCVLLSDDGGRGFGGLDVARASAAYDPRTGLTISVPVSRYDRQTAAEESIRFTVNQATGRLTVER